VRWKRLAVRALKAAEGGRLKKKALLKQLLREAREQHGAALSGEADAALQAALEEKLTSSKRFQESGKHVQLATEAAGSDGVGCLF